MPGFAPWRAGWCVVGIGGVGEPYMHGCGLWAALSSETLRGPARASRAPGTPVSEERFGGNARTHTHMHAHTCTYMSARARMLTHAHTCTPVYSHVYTPTYTCIHCHTCTLTRTHLHTCSHTCLHTRVLTRAHTHACHIDLCESPEEKPRVLSPEGAHGSLTGRAGA